MNPQEKNISPVRKKRLEAQGYENYSDQELFDHKFGIRFAYALCTALFAFGLIFTSKIILAIAATVAFLGALPPYHPFDYLYNYFVLHLIHKPKLPPRANQGRFACGIASVWLLGIILLFHNGYLLAGYFLGGILLVVALLVTVFDICIPSMVYNVLFKRKK